MKKGYVQVYTGNGKGKTSAALGLALRAAGAKFQVFIGQFTKGRSCSEHKALERFKDYITVKQYGEPGFINGKPSEQDILYAQKALHEIRQVIGTGKYDLVIMEEANIATHYKLIEVDGLLELIRNKPDHVELVITGRYADPRIIEAADLVTEMREIKHYKKQGVAARIGIEK
jgi:cob(I)alamin adenosyltransferase